MYGGSASNPVLVSPQMKMASSEQQVAELTRSLELLMREKKELELKERIMRYSLEGLSLHLDHLFADKVRLLKQTCCSLPECSCSPQSNKLKPCCTSLPKVMQNGARRRLKSLF